MPLRGPQEQVRQSLKPGIWHKTFLPFLKIARNVRIFQCYHLTHQTRMWVYQPWIDQLCGGKLPETTEEFYDYLRKVATMPI